MFFEEYGADLTTFTGVDYYSGKRVLNGSPAARALPYVTLFEQLRAAGAQVKNHTVQQTLDELLQSINKFYES